jgi:hypothetical protein
MSKNFRRLSWGLGLGHFVVFGEDNWKAMESKNVYGHSLPRKVRDLVSLATLYPTLVLPLEKSAPRLSDDNEKKSLVEKELACLKKQAEELRTKLFSAHHWASEYQPDRDHLDLGFRLALELDEAGGSEADDFDLLRISLGATIESCERVLKKVSLADYGNRDRQSWDIWVVLLTLIMKSNQLPWNTRKDAYQIRNSEEKFLPPPFIRLIKYLQDCALKGYKRSNTDGGLAKAIDRARASIVVSDIERKDPEKLIFGMLGASKKCGGRYGDYSDMQFMVDRVLEGRWLGVHPVVPEPLYYSEDFPPPAISE